MKTTKHTLSNYKLLTAKMGYLVPIGLQEALPGDTFQISSSAMLRVSPLAAPVMHPVTVRIHHFFVPHRLVWEGFEDFITGGPDGNDASSVPSFVADEPSVKKGSLMDYYGVPPNAIGTNLSLLPRKGYAAIWNEYFRDQDLQGEVPDERLLQRIAWEKDYFTTARPWTQKGDDVTIPFGGRGDVVTKYSGNTDVQTWEQAATGQSFGELYGEADGNATFNDATPPPGFARLRDGAPTFLEAEYSGTTVSVNDFRRAFALQRYQEARARYGSRYTEYLRYLGVTPSDARLQRPEYLGGGSTSINFSEVLQTARNDEGQGDTGFGIGDMYGHGIAAMRSNKVRRFIEEHGYIHSFLSVRPKAVYQNGIHRHFLKRTREDFFQKELESIGQQPIWQNEIYAKAGQDYEDVFGYQDRYSEYRSTPSTVAGDFRDTLNYWHMARDLPDTTVLNSEFVACNPTERIHNVQGPDTLWCMVNNHVVARRMVRKNAQSRIM